MVVALVVGLFQPGFLFQPHDLHLEQYYLPPPRLLLFQHRLEHLAPLQLNWLQHSPPLFLDHPPQSPQPGHLPLPQLALPRPSPRLSSLLLEADAL